MKQLSSAGRIAEGRSIVRGIFLVLGVVAACGMGNGCGGGQTSEKGSPAQESAGAPARPGIPLREVAQRPAAPEIQGSSLAGTLWSLRAQRGKVVVIDFWATWCGPCRAAIPHLVEITREMGPRGVEIVGISLDRGGNEFVEPFARQMGINYPVVVDGEARLASTLGGVEAIPTFFLVDRRGKLAAQVRGLVPKELLTDALETLLSEG
jgi:thiol-disulfide isomerase/thioredoxin